MGATVAHRLFGKSPHILIATKVKLFNTTCVTILLYGCESWVISYDMENKINAFATSCYRVMLNIKRIDHDLNTTIYSMTDTVHLIQLVRHRQPGGALSTRVYPGTCR